MIVKGFLLNLYEVIWAWPHEFAHFITGRVLGVEVILRRRSVDVPIEIPDWKHLIILIAPTLLGIGVMLGSIAVPFIYGLTRRPALIGTEGFLYSLGLLSTCIGDWKDIVRYFKTGEIT